MRYSRDLRARQPGGRRTLLQQAIAAIRRNNAVLFYVPSNFAGAWTDSAGTDAVNEIGDVVGRVTDRAAGGAVATQATTANKPTVSLYNGRPALSFDGTNDALQFSGNPISSSLGAAYTIIAGGVCGPLGGPRKIYGDGARDFGIEGSSTGRLQLVHRGSNVQMTLASPPLSSGQVFVAEATWDGTSGRIQLESSASVTSSLVAPTTAIGSAFVGQRGNGTEYWNSQLNAVVVAGSVIPIADREIIQRLIRSLQGR